MHAYEEWGEHAFTHLRGMFAIALWDARARRLLLVARPRRHQAALLRAVGAPLRLRLRDQVDPRQRRGHAGAGAGGPRPLPLVPLHAAHGIDLQGHPEAARPGTCCRGRDDRFEVRPYWTQPTDETFTGTDADAVQTLRSVLADAVSSHMVSDVPIGAFLSGGIDSGVVVGLMAEASTRPVKTFSIGFDEPEFDELEAARRTARALRDRPPRVRGAPRRPRRSSISWSITSTSRSPTRRPFPPGTSASSPPRTSRWSCRATAATSCSAATIAISRTRASRPSTAGPGALGRRIAGAAWPLVPHGRRGRNFLRHVAQDPRGRYVGLRGLLPARREARAVLAGAAAHRGHVVGRRAAGGAGSTPSPALDWHSQMMRVDFETYLPEDVLTKVDRMSMAHSLESRVPLLDHAVVQFAASLPSHMKIRNGERKHLFKRAASTVLPAERAGAQEEGVRGANRRLAARAAARGLRRHPAVVARQAARILRHRLHRPAARRTHQRQARTYAAPVAAAGVRAVAPALSRSATRRRRRPGRARRCFAQRHLRCHKEESQ